jgi:hypothetical protein
MERTQSAASETEEAARESESRPPSYTADEFLTGAGSKHAKIMRSAAIELLGAPKPHSITLQWFMLSLRDGHLGLPSDRNSSKVLPFGFNPLRRLYLKTSTGNRRATISFRM